MPMPVDLDDERSLVTIKIRNKRADGVLTTKLVATQLFASKL